MIHRSRYACRRRMVFGFSTPWRERRQSIEQRQEMPFLDHFRRVTSRGRQYLPVIGGMCNTVYMYRWLAISGLVRVTGQLRTGNFAADYLLQLTLMVVPIFAISAALFLLFEK